MRVRLAFCWDLGLAFSFGLVSPLVSLGPSNSLCMIKKKIKIRQCNLIVRILIFYTGHFNNKRNFHKILTLLIYSKHYLNSNKIS